MRTSSILIALGLVVFTAPLAEANRKSSFKKVQFKLEYRAALDQLARGQKESALADLLELESSSLEQTNADPRPLWNAKLSVVRDLLGEGPHVLVPLSQFHQSAYRAYLSEGSHALAAHSRALTMELAELYADRVRGDHGKRTASAVMTSLAGYLQAASMSPLAADLFDRAVEIDEYNVAARLGRAAIHERHGEYEEAVPFLRELLERAPNDPEGSLRLALHLARLDEAEEAESLLRGLTRSPAAAPRWVRSLAYQELARLLIDESEYEQAVALVEVAGRELPGDPTLPLLLAYATDRAGQASSKSALAVALRDGAESGDSSPRYRYSQMPHEALDQLRASLSGESRAQMPTLAAALSDGSQSAIGSR